MNPQSILYKLLSLRLAILLVVALLAFGTQASDQRIQPFHKESIQQILDNHQSQPLMIVFWSIECSSCLKELRLIGEFLISNPDMMIVFVSTDTDVDFQQIAEVMVKRGLPLNNAWAFAESNAQALRYTVDPKWYGELPRTYFYDNHHQRTGLSGAISHDQLAKWSAYINNPDETATDAAEI